MDDGKETKFRDAGLVIADEAAELVSRLRKYVRGGRYKAAGDVSADLQRAARDLKWLMRRQPKEGKQNVFRQN